jgi:hypothetical protein
MVGEAYIKQPNQDTIPATMDVIWHNIRVLLTAKKSPDRDRDRPGTRSIGADVGVFTSWAEKTETKEKTKRSDGCVEADISAGSSTDLSREPTSH